MKLTGNRSGRRNQSHLITMGRRKMMLLCAATSTISAGAFVCVPALGAVSNDAYDTAPTAVSGVYNFSNNFTLGTTTPAPSGIGTPASGDSLYFGTNTAGTTVNNDQTGDTFGGLTFNIGASAFTIGGNAFTLSGAITNNSTSLETINNAITDASALVVTGPGAVTLGSASNSLTGLTLGTTVTDNANTNVAVTGESGVTLNLTNSQSLGALAVGGGANVINVGSNAAISTTAIAPTSTSDRFGVLNINLGAGASVTTNTLNSTGGIIALGSQFNVVTLNGTDFASNSTNTAGGTLVAPTYTSSTTTAVGTGSQNTNVVTNVSLAGAATTNTLRFVNTSNETITQNGYQLGIGGSNGYGGAILMGVGSDNVTNTISGGVITGSSNRGLGVFNFDTTSGSSLVINSNYNNFVNSGAGANSTAQLLVAGGGAVALGGSNFVNGPLLVDGSTLSVASDANLGGANSTVSVASATNGSTLVTLSAPNTLTSGLAAGDILLGQVVYAISNTNGTGTMVTLASNYTGTTFTTATTVGFSEGGSVNLNGGTLLATNSFSLSETGTQSTDTTLGVTDVRNRNVGLGLKGGTFDVTSTNTLTIPGVISGAALTKSDTGTLLLTGVETYTGATTISGGTLQVGPAGQLNSVAYAGAISNSGTLEYSSSAAQTLSGAISGNGSLLKDTSATSTLTLSASNSYTGGTSINAGTLVASVGGALGATSSAITLGNSTAGANAALSSGANTTFAQAITVASGGGTRTIVSTGFGGASIFSGAVTLNGDLILQGMGGGTSDQMRFGAGGITGSNNISINDNVTTATNSIRLDGTNTNWTGGLNVLAGYAKIGNAAAVNGNTLVTLTGGASATFDTNNFSPTIAGLSGTGSSTVTNSGGSAQTLTLGGSGNTYSGVITAATPANLGLTVALAGSGLQTLTGSSTYAGATTVRGGTLALNDSANPGGTILAGTTFVSAGSATNTGTLILTSAAATPALINVIATSSTGATLSITDNGMTTGNTAVVNLNFNGNGPGSGGVPVETIFGLLINNIPQAIGYYGAVAANGATNPDGDFAGTGELDVVGLATSTPEPGSLSILSLGGLGLMRRRRKPAAKPA